MEPQAGHVRARAHASPRATGGEIVGRHDNLHDGLRRTEEAGSPEKGQEPAQEAGQPGRSVIDGAAFPDEVSQGGLAGTFAPGVAAPHQIATGRLPTVTTWSASRNNLSRLQRAAPANRSRSGGTASGDRPGCAGAACATTAHRWPTFSSRTRTAPPACGWRSAISARRTGTHMPAAATMASIGRTPQHQRSGADRRPRAGWQLRRALLQGGGTEAPRQTLRRRTTATIPRPGCR